jgi:bile acid:Na+ symporter, BASS family
MSAQDLVKLALQASIFLTVLGVGLDATWQDATQLLRKPGLLARSLLSMFVIMPVICVAVALVSHLPPAIKVALVALAISPVPPFVTKKELMAGGHGAYVVSLVSLSAVFSIVFVPVVTSLFAQWFDHPAQVPPGKVAQIVLTTILVPVFLGIVLRSILGARAAMLSRPVGLIGITLLVVAVVPLLIRLWPLVSSFIGDGTVISLAAIALLATLVGHMLGGPDPWDRAVLGLSTSARHPAVAITIATSAYPEGKLALGAVLLYVLVVTIVTIPYVIWCKRHQQPAGAAA